MSEKVPHDHNRNFIAKKFLESDCEWMISCDDDIAPPENIIDIIHPNRLLVAAYARAHPYTPPHQANQCLIESKLCEW